MCNHKVCREHDCDDPKHKGEWPPQFRGHVACERGVSCNASLTPTGVCHRVHNQKEFEEALKEREFNEQQLWAMLDYYHKNHSWFLTEEHNKQRLFLAQKLCVGLSKEDQRELKVLELEARLMGAAPAYVPQQMGGAPGYVPQQMGGAPAYMPQMGGAPGYMPQQMGGAPAYMPQMGGVPGYMPQMGGVPGYIPPHMMMLMGMMGMMQAVAHQPPMPHQQAVAYQPPMPHQQAVAHQPPVPQGQPIALPLSEAQVATIDAQIELKRTKVAMLAAKKASEAASAESEKGLLLRSAASAAPKVSNGGGSSCPAPKESNSAAGGGSSCPAPKESNGGGSSSPEPEWRTVIKGKKGRMSTVASPANVEQMEAGGGRDSAVSLLSEATEKMKGMSWADTADEEE
jgi:hypothetical protein